MIFEDIFPSMGIQNNHINKPDPNSKIFMPYAISENRPKLNIKITIRKQQDHRNASQCTGFLPTSGRHPKEQPNECCDGFHNNERSEYGGKIYIDNIVIAKLNDWIKRN